MKTRWTLVLVVGIIGAFLMATQFAIPTVLAKTQTSTPAALPSQNAPHALSGATMEWLENGSGGLTMISVSNTLFANVIAASGDGNTVIAGEPNATINGKTNQGQVWIVSRANTGSWQLSSWSSSDGVTNDHFGNAVATNNDGSTILIGAYHATVNGHSNQGKVYVYTFTGGGPALLQGTLTASDGAIGDYFGASVSLSSDGNTAVVGAPGRNSSRGAVYVFTRSGTTWSQLGVNPITTFDAAASDLFGNAVTLSGDGLTVIGSAPNKAVNAGAAYAYIRSGNAWNFQHKFTVTGGVAGDDFGRSVSMSNDGNTALIGADLRTVNGHAAQGAAYLFTRSGTVWSNGTMMTSSDGVAGDWFGYSVALSGDASTIVIGAPDKTIEGQTLQGTGYVFYGTGFSKQQHVNSYWGAHNGRSGFAVTVNGDGAGVWVGSPYLFTASTDQGVLSYFQEYASAWWQQDEKLSAIWGGYGHAVSVSNDGNSAIVGSSGATHIDIYTRSNGTWLPPITIAKPDNDPSSTFGRAVAMSGDGNTAILGDPSGYVGGTDKGMAYITMRSAGVWSTPIKLTAPDGASGDNFGAAVAISKNGMIAVIGAPNKNSNEGAAYVSVRSGNNWSAPVKIASPAGLMSYFGTAVALNGDGSTLLIGTPDATNNINAVTGGVYVFVGTGGVYSQQTELILNGSSQSASFGHAVALSNDGNTALVGLPGLTTSNPNQGSALVYVRAGTNWSLQTPSASPLLPRDSIDNKFGFAVSLSLDGNLAVIGAPTTNGSSAYYSGADYIYTRSGTTWSMQAKHIPSDQVNGDQMGFAVAMSGDGHTVFSGANNKTSGNGAFYIFSDLSAVHALFLPLIVR